MTTTASSRTTPGTAVVRRARSGAVGAVLWTLSSGVWAASDLEEQPYGTLACVAVAVAWWTCMVAAPFLVLAGHSALQAVLAPRTGRLGRAGIAVSAAGLAGMGLGIGIEVASMSAGGGEVAAGHAVLLASFVGALLGGLVTGVTAIRRLADPAARVGGWVLALALPLGIGAGLLGSVLAPDDDAGFWAVLTLPTGLGWLLLGWSLAAEHRIPANP